MLKTVDLQLSKFTIEHNQSIWTIKERYQEAILAHTDVYRGERYAIGRSVEITSLMLDVWLKAETDSLEVAQAELIALAERPNRAQPDLLRWRRRGGYWFHRPSVGTDTNYRHYGDCIVLAVASDIGLETEAREIKSRTFQSEIGEHLATENLWPTRVLGKPFAEYRATDVLAYLGHLAQTGKTDIVWGLLNQLKNNPDAYNSATSEWNKNFVNIPAPTSQVSAVPDPTAKLWEAIVYCQLGAVDEAETALEIGSSYFAEFDNFNFVAIQLGFIVEAKLLKLKGEIPTMIAAPELPVMIKFTN